MGAKIEAAMEAKLITEAPPMAQPSDNDILQEMNGKAAAEAAADEQPPRVDSEC